MTHFQIIYKDLLHNKGYKGTFIKRKIAEHCGVSVHTVDKWVSGQNVRDCYTKLLESFEVN